MVGLFIQRTRRASLNRWHSRFDGAMQLLLWIALCVVRVSAQTPQLPPVAPLTPSTSSLPATLEQQPPADPIIVYKNGLLTITAANSTLHDVLQGIREQTGAEIDIPSQADERVATRVGPGLARDVVESLLAGSQFNYVLVGSAVDPKALTRVLLFLKPPPELRSKSVTTAAAVPQPSGSDTAAVLMQPADGSPDSVLPVRSQQQMLQQHRQMIMEQFHQSARP